MVMGKHQPHGGGKGEAAVAAVGGILLEPPVRPHRCGQVVRVGKRMHREDLVPDTHLRGGKADVFQCGGVLLREGEILLDDAGLLSGTDNLVRREAFKPHQP